MTDGFLMMDLLRAYYWFDEALQRSLKAHGWEDVSRAKSLVLVNVALGIDRASRLARNVGVSRQAMSQMVLEMQASGLLHVKPDPTDGRAQVVSFSSRSAKIRDDAMRILAAIEHELGNRLGTVGVNALKGALAADWGPSPTSEVIAANSPKA